MGGDDDLGQGRNPSPFAVNTLIIGCSGGGNSR